MSSSKKPPPAPRSFGSVVTSTAVGWFTSSSSNNTNNTSTSTSSSSRNETNPMASSSTTTTTSTVSTSFQLTSEHRSLSAPILPERMNDRNSSSSSSTSHHHHTTTISTTNHHHHDTGITNTKTTSVVLRPPSALGIPHDTHTTDRSSTPSQPPQQPPQEPPFSSSSDTPPVTSNQLLVSPHERRIRAVIRRYHQRREALEYTDTTTMLFPSSPPQPSSSLPSLLPSSSTTTFDSILPPPTHISTMCYQGMEIMVAGHCIHKNINDDTSSSSANVVFGFLYVICPRTHFVYQALPLYHPKNTSERIGSHESNDTTILHIISMVSHPMTGLLCVAMSNGTIYTYYPLPNDPKYHINGAFHWEVGPTISCTEYFTHWNYNRSNNFDMSVSYTNQICIAYQNQLAVFEIHSGGTDTSTTTTSNVVWTMELVWMTQVSKYIQTASISGDGNAIAVVLLPQQHVSSPPPTAASNTTTTIETNVTMDNDDDDDDDDDSSSSDDAAANGIYTYEREWMEPNHNLYHSGVLYKPGPFLVHPAPVTHISFRGDGNRTSSSSVVSTPPTTTTDSTPQPPQSNDLLLSVCSSDCTVRIYGQNSWSPLTEWVTPVNTRVDFMQGTASFTIGDFLNPKSDDKQNRTTENSTKSSSKSSFHHSTQQTTADPMHEVYGKRIQIPTIPNHFPVPSTHAGAWIYELTIPPSPSDVSLQPLSPPSLRISRLTYLERGIDDLNPTLLECISSYIPISTCFIGNVNRQHILHHRSACSVHGIWPAWNPFLSTTTTKSTSEQKDNHHSCHTMDAISGSAMEFLGLSSGPSTGTANVMGNAGYFGGHGSLGGTQCPPCEIRISMGHAIVGQVTLMDFAIFGDRALTQVALGNPRRNILSIAHLNDRKPHQLQSHHGKENNRGANNPCDNHLTVVKASVSYETSRLIAEVQSDSNSISIIWQKPGSMSFLPDRWLPDDVEPARALAILQNSSNHVTDESLIPVPLVLPTLHIHGSTAVDQLIDQNTRIRLLLWWPDHKYNGSPLLVAIMNTGTIVVFEIPPPYCSSELSIPNHGPPLPPCTSMDLQGLSPSQSDDNSVDSQASSPATEFEVAVMPDPEFGLGLRLEAPPNGIGAFVGSFKRHPLSGDALPAEMCDRIRIDDDLLNANDIDLESKHFDEIVTVVREISLSCGPGNPIRMKFRRSTVVKNKTHAHNNSDSLSVERRSMEQILGVSPVSIRRKGKSGKSRRHGPTVSEEKQSHSNEKYVTAGKRPLNISAAVGIFHNAVARVDDNTSSFDTESKFKIVPLDGNFESLIATGTRTACLIWGDKNSIMANLIKVPNDNESIEAEPVHLGSYCIRSESSPTSDSSICAIATTEEFSKSHTIIVCLHVGEVHLVSMSINTSDSGKDPTVTFQSFYLFHLHKQWVSGSVVKAYSSTLIATMQRNSDYTYPYDATSDVIKIWTASPTPGCKLNDIAHDDETTRTESNYVATDVFAECSSENEIIDDFAFIHPGTLDSRPSLVLYTSHRATFLQMNGGGLDWIPNAHILYNSKFWDGPLSLMHNNGAAMCTCVTAMPQDNFPHIIDGLRSIYSSKDERELLRSDWHPVCLLSTICGSMKGPKTSLFGSVRSIFLWLCSDTNKNATGTLIVAPLSLHIRQTELEAVDRPKDIMTVLTARVEVNPDDVLIRNFLSSLRTYIETTNISPPLNHVYSKEDTTTPSSNLPPTLLQMSVEELRTLLVIGGMILDPPELDSLDDPAQLYLFCNSFMEKWRDCMKQIAPETPKRRSMPAHGVVVRSTLVATKSSYDTDESIPSAGTLAALLSGDQVLLMRTLRASAPRISWQFVRERRIAFWERSNDALALIAEEIGSGVFLESRDVMESALFYILSKKMTTLQNLAKSDQSSTGRIFAKFLTDYDFSSERGRRAAEKNAFSLLRKCRYQVAAAFFLLPNPPFLTAALETIATKMNDVDLAFFVARLTETPANRGQPGAVSAGFGKVLGGGGGYAAGETDFAGTGKAHFKVWKPNLGTESRKLLIDRVLPSAVDDSIMTAVSLIWLGKNEEAAWFVSRIVEVSHAGLTTYCTSKDASQSFLEANMQFNRDGQRRRQQLSWLSLTNSVINFSSAGPLLKILDVSSRVRFASALVVSQALSAVGGELCSILTLRNVAEDLLNADNVGADDEDGVNGIHDVNNTSRNAMENNSTNSGIISSSIFDDYSCPPTRIHPTKPVPAESHSSIFDDFDVQPMPTKTTSTVADPSQSSIFDDFNGPPPSYHTSKVASNGGSAELQSSIFDNFDMPTARPSMKDSVQSKNCVEMVESSIFDDFYVPQHPPNRIPIKETVSIKNHSDTQYGMGTSVIMDTPIELQISLNIVKSDPPKIWYKWRKSIILESASKRLLREIATVVSQFEGDIDRSLIVDLYQDLEYLNHSRASEILIVHCDCVSILGKVHRSLDDLVMISNLKMIEIVEHAIAILGYSHCHRIVFSVILLALVRRDDLAEDIIRESASRLIHNCHSLSTHLDMAAHSQRTIGYISSLSLRREAARISWQLETCLWMHRGGGLILSNDAIKECIVAVRMGILAASWKRDFDCINAMIFNDPDCMIDEDAGHLIWSSLKDIDTSGECFDSTERSEGWEFLVECKRSQATDLLRGAPSGCFLIRPHADDDGVFTLSFKTNLDVTTSDIRESSVREDEVFTPDTSADELSDFDNLDKPRRVKKKKVRKDDVVQHAIIRLSDSGFRCGSFGPFTSLLALLETVSSSLPFQLRFDMPPKHRVIRSQKRLQTSPNAIFLRKLSLHKTLSPFAELPAGTKTSEFSYQIDQSSMNDAQHMDNHFVHTIQRSCFGTFSQLIMLSLLRRQLSSIAASITNDGATFVENKGDHLVEGYGVQNDNCDSDGRKNDVLAHATRVLNPLLTWCRIKELSTASALSSELFFDWSHCSVLSRIDTLLKRSDKVNAESVDAIEVSPLDSESYIEGGDSVLRGMIRQESGIEFSTLRLVDAGECTMLVLFSRHEAIRWLISSGIEQTDDSAMNRLNAMEKLRVIERVDITRLTFKFKNADPNIEDVRYRFVDPWEVEPLSSRDSETRNAALGRERYVGFNLGQVLDTTEIALRQMGGSALLELWSMTKSSVLLTKAIAAAHPPWEKCCIGDLQLTNGKVTEPPPFVNSIRRCLFRNSLYRRLDLPQRFIAIIQVELLDLKNLTTPGGSLSLTAYALLRLKRIGSSGILTNKARTIDSASTSPMKLNKTSGPNAPASWGSVVRFRFPLPEDADSTGNSSHTNSRDRETLFKGPPRVLQISVYEKKLLADHAIGSADVTMDGLSAGGQIEEWVPLRSEKLGTITWFSRIRISLRFEIMNLAPAHMDHDSIPSVGLQRIDELTHKSGGSIHEDSTMQQHHRSMSSSDLRGIGY